MYLDETKSLYSFERHHVLPLLLDDEHLKLGFGAFKTPVQVKEPWGLLALIYISNVPFVSRGTNPARTFKLLGTIITFCGGLRRVLITEPQIFPVAVFQKSQAFPSYRQSGTFRSSVFLHQISLLLTSVPSKLS